MCLNPGIACRLNGSCASSLGLGVLRCGKRCAGAGRRCGRSGPETKKRPRPGQATHNETELMTCEYIAGQKFVKKPKNSTTKIIETDGVVHVLFYKNQADDEDANDI